jgi:SAM-dependent methyltransferase
MSLRSGERQVATTLDAIRADHVARYRWAAQILPPASRVLDFGCGIGYGAMILAEAGHSVLAFDIDAETVAFAAVHFAHPNITYRSLGCFPVEPLDAVIAFEVIEHLAEPAIALAAMSAAPILLASVPNEEVFPFQGHKFHHRHYRPDEFRALLDGAGFGIESWWGQAGPESDVEPNVAGRTLVAVARRGVATVAVEVPVSAINPRAPEHVVILGLGPSLEAYVDRVKRMGSRKAFADEVWGINAVGDVIQCDKIFHLDDVRIQEIRAAARPQSNIAHMLGWMKTHPGPIFTSRAYPEYPGLVEYPLAEVINGIGLAYFAGTAAYAVAYAIHIGVKRLSIFGCDYSYRDSKFAERGRANLEFWLGLAYARGIEICVPEQSSLLDTYEPEETQFYGFGKFGTRDVVMTVGLDHVAKVEFRERAELPTAEEIENAYDHSRPANRGT